MQAALYRRFHELVDSFRQERKPKREVWVHKLFKALDWGDRATFSTSSTQDGFSLDVDNCRVINVVVESPRNVEKVYGALNRAYNQDVAWVIATDFDRLGVFGSYWFSFPHDVTSALAFSVDYNEYLVEAQKFNLFTPHEVARNRLDEFYSAFPHRRKRQPIDLHLVERMGQWRRLALDSLSEPISEDDPLVHRLINALFLVRYMEDSGVIDSRLENLISEPSNAKCVQGLRKILTVVREEIGYKVPSGRDLERLEIAPLRSLVRQLYGFPEWGVRYDFAAMSVDILGRFYEEYLKLNLAKPVRIPKKTETLYLLDAPTYELKDIRKQRGIFYTPRFIVDYIVSNLLDRFESTSPSNSPVIADLSCGSGTFLGAAIDRLSKTRKLNAQTIKRIVGLDIDPRAIEAARLNLTAKLLSKSTPKPLPDLNLHEYDLIGRGVDTAELKSLLPNGIDLIVGNPPYIHYEKLAENYAPDVIAKNFNTASKRVDSYMLFVEAALRLVQPGGLCGLVLPNAMLRSQAAVPLRKFLAENADILEVIDFLDQPVFQGVGIYVCLLLFRKRVQGVPQPQVTVARVYRLSATPNAQLAKLSVNSDVSMQGHEVFHAAQPSAPGPWIFRNATEQQILESVEREAVRLGRAVEIRQGVKTGADRVFLIETKEGTSSVFVENEITVPILRNRELRRWHSRPTASLLFPYDRKSRKLLPWKIMERQFPRAANHLSSNKQHLQNRRSLRGKQWYELIEPRLPTVTSDKSKLFIAELSVRPIVTGADDPNTAIVGSTGGGSWLVLEDERFERWSLMAYLNSVVAEWYFRQVSSLRRGGWLVLEQHLIESLPLPKFLCDQESFARHQISQLAQQLGARLAQMTGPLN